MNKHIYVVEHLFEYGGALDRFEDIETSNWREALHSYKKVRAFYDSVGEYVLLSKYQLDNNGERMFGSRDDIYVAKGHRKESY